MSIKLNTLYFFSVVASLDSFNEAAEQLGVSQQALSKAIAQLEEDLGHPLILRNNRGGDRLTYAGRMLLTRSQTLLHSVLELEHLFYTDTEPTDVPNRIRIGSMSILDHIVSQTVQAYKEKQHVHPTLLLFHSQSRLENELLNQMLDLAVSSQPALSSELDSYLLRSTPFVIIGNKHMQGAWHELEYLSFNDDPRQGGCFNHWPEEQWPRKVLGKFDITMATQLCIQGIACIHIPQAFLPIRGPLGLKNNNLAILVEPPFQAFFNRYLLLPKASVSPSVQQFKQELLTKCAEVYS
jgi:DNA-binding transcriptional LysR family regulator